MLICVGGWMLLSLANCYVKLSYLAAGGSSIYFTGIKEVSILSSIHQQKRKLVSPNIKLFF